MADEDLWGELCLCILSSNVPYEMASSAFNQLLCKGLIDPHEASGVSSRRVARELNRSIYLPRRKDGLFRRYRFPNLRASNLAEAWEILYDEGNGIKALLQETCCPESTRSKLVRTVPGLGLKEASHFLRNVKFSDTLAIIDSHIVKFVQEFVGLQFRGCPSSQQYLEVEGILKDISTRFGLSLGVMDMAIWESMRVVTA